MEERNPKLMLQRPLGMLVERFAFAAKSHAGIGEAARVPDSIVFRIQIPQAADQPRIVQNLKAPVYRPDVGSAGDRVSEKPGEIATPEDEILREQPQHLALASCRIEQCLPARACHFLHYAAEDRADKDSRATCVP